MNAGIIRIAVGLAIMATQTILSAGLPVGKVVWWSEGDSWNSFSQRQSNGVLFCGNDIATNIVAIVAEGSTALVLDKTGTVFSYSRPNAFSMVATNVNPEAFGANNMLWMFQRPRGAADGAATSKANDLVAGLNNASALLPFGQAYRKDYLILMKDGLLLGWLSPREPFFGQPFYLYAGFNLIVANKQILTNVMAVTLLDRCLYLALKTDGTVIALGSSDRILPASPSPYFATIATNMIEGMVSSTTTAPAWNFHFPFAALLSCQGTVLSNITAMAGAGRKVMLLRKDGTVAVYESKPGKPAGEIPEFVSVSVPDGVSNVVAMAASLTKKSALKRDGTVVAWADDRNRPASMPAGLTNVVAIAEGNGISLALITGDLPASIYVPPHGPLEEKVLQADLVFKGEVIQSERCTNRQMAALMHRSAAGFPDAFATKLKLISLLKGSCQTNEVILYHFKNPEKREIPTVPFGGRIICWSGSPPPLTFNFEPGKSYLVYAKKKCSSAVDSTRVASLEEYIPLENSEHFEPVPRVFHPVTYTLDNRPLSGLSVNQAHWLELNLLLNDHNPTNQIFAIERLSRMATAFGDTWENSHDFKLESVLAAIHPLLNHASDEIAVAALGCFQGKAGYVSQLDPYINSLIEIASNANSAVRRAAAIAVFTGTGLPILTNSLDRWLTDSDPTVRVRATHLLLDFPGPDAEQALAALARDPNASVRAAAAEVIGKGKFARNIAMLAALFDDPDGAVHTNAGLALLVFSPEDTAPILTARLSDAGFYIQFIARLSDTNARPWLPQLVGILEARYAQASQAPSGQGNSVAGSNPSHDNLLTGAYASCWENICRYLMSLPPNQLSDRKMSRYTDLLEKMLPKKAPANREAVHQLYELYRTKNLWVSAVKLRHHFREEKDWFDQFDQAFPKSNL